MDSNAKSAVDPKPSPTSGWTNRRKALRIKSYVRVMEEPMSPQEREKALRTYCDWMIDAFLKDRGADHGKSLGLL
jgi:hypothetical protein